MKYNFMFLLNFIYVGKAPCMPFAFCQPFKRGNFASTLGTRSSR